MINDRKIRAVSVGGNRAWARLAQIVQAVVVAELEKESGDLPGRVAAAVADAAHQEGLALTWQVR